MFEIDEREDLVPFDEDFLAAQAAARFTEQVDNITLLIKFMKNDVCGLYVYSIDTVEYL